MRRELHIELNRDRDCPFFSNAYFRRRWTWRTMFTNESPDKPFGIYEGHSAFSITALIKAHFPSLFGSRIKGS